MDLHQDDARVQEKACSAIMFLALNDANQVPLMAAGAHACIIRAMERHQDDALVQEWGCSAITNLASNVGNCKIFQDMDVHERILKSMEIQAAVSVQFECVRTLFWLLHSGYDRRIMALAATRQILLTMRLHPTNEVSFWACSILYMLATNRENNVFMIQAGVRDALLDVYRTYAVNDQDWTVQNEAEIFDDEMDGMTLSRCVRLTMIRLAWFESDARVEDTGSVVIDRMRRIWIEHTQLQGWGESSVDRLSGPINIFSGKIPKEYWARVAIYSFGGELIPDSGWFSEHGQELANKFLFKKAYDKVLSLIL
jgi:hypothetical protein